MVKKMFWFSVRGYDNTSIKVESGVQTNIIHDLLQKRQILMAELNNYTKASNEGHGIPVRFSLLKSFIYKLFTTNDRIISI